MSDRPDMCWPYNEIFDLRAQLTAKEAEIARLREYARHKPICPLNTTYQHAHNHHFEWHDADIDWPNPTCGSTDCEAWAKAGEDGQPECICGLADLLHGAISETQEPQKKEREDARMDSPR